MLAGCGGGGSSDAAGSTGSATTAATTHGADAAPKTVTITVKNAAPVGGIQRATVAKGDEVVLVVHSDVADEIHVHGYNLKQDVAAGGTATDHLRRRTFRAGSRPSSRTTAPRSQT